MAKSKKYVLLFFSLILCCAVIITCSACQKTSDLKSQEKFHGSEDISMKYDGFYKNLMDFTKNQQLLDRDM